jgi:chromosome segregation protein
MQSVENSLQGYGLKRASRKKKYDEIAAASAQLERQAQEAEQRAKLLSDMEKNMEGFGASVKAVMQQVRMGYLEGVYGPVSSLIRVADEHTLAIEISLGAALQNIAVDNEETAKRAIQMLRSQKAGRATFLPVSSIKGRRMDVRGVDAMPGFVGVACDLVKHDARYEEIVASLLGRTVICEDLDRAVEMAKKHAYRFRIVTLDGQVVNAGGAMTGGYVEKSAGLLSRQSQIARLTERAREVARAAGAQHARRRRRPGV